MIHVHLIDDDQVLSGQVKDYLDGHGFQVSISNSAEQGLIELERNKFSLVLLDVMMPGMDGFTALQQLRKKSNVPVIMLTARGEVIDRVLGLEIGADDYMAKPFEPRELVARIKSVLKRTNRSVDEKIVSGDLTIDPNKREILVGKKIIEVTTMEYDLIFLLVSNPGRKFTRDEIISHLNSHESESFGRSIDNLVSRVRKKIESDKSGSCIETVWGTGYMYVERPSEKAKKKK